MPARRTVIASAAVLAAITLTGCTGSRPAGPPHRAEVAATLGPATPTRGPARIAPDREFAVGTRSDTYVRDGSRRLVTTTWYPASGRPGAGPARGAEPYPARFPVVLFSHGLGGAPADYAPLLVEWAAAGFVVVAPAYPHTVRGAASIEIADVLNQPADASYVLTQVLANGAPLDGHLDAEHLAAGGHSAGAITTVGLFTSSRDDRLGAGVVLAGNGLGVGTDYRGRAAPMLFVHGTADPIVPYSSGKAAYDRVPWPKAMLTLPGQGHGDLFLRRDSPVWKALLGTTVDFLRWALYGDESAKRRLPADAAPDAGGGPLDDHL